MYMKEDFVTNSSSSNFVLVFKNEDSYNEFKEYCDSFGYTAVFELIDNLRNTDNEYVKPKSKEEIKEMVYNYYSYDIKEELFKEMIPDYENLNWNERHALENRISELRDFKEKVHKKVYETTECPRILKKINSSNIVVEGTIWDTDGGLLEWAIRNDLLNKEFRKWCVLNYNCG